MSTYAETACLILASGRGRRMGGPKALLLWDSGIPLAVAHARACLEISERVLVARAPVVRRLRPRLQGTRLVSSCAPGVWGPAGSIAAAVHSGALARIAWVLITPVDLVPPSRETIHALLESTGPHVQAVRPSHNGRGGHPVVVRSDVLHRFFARVGTPPTLRDVLRAVEQDCVWVSVNDPDIRKDLDTPQAYHACTGHEPRFLG